MMWIPFFQSVSVEWFPCSITTMQLQHHRNLIHFPNNGSIVDLSANCNRNVEFLFLHAMESVYYEWALDDSCWHRLARVSIKQMYMNIITSSDPLCEITAVIPIWENGILWPIELRLSGVIGCVIWKGVPILIRAGFSTCSLGYGKMLEPVRVNALHNLLLSFEMEEDTAEETLWDPSFFIFQLSTSSNYI